MRRCNIFVIVSLLFVRLLTDASESQLDWLNSKVVTREWLAKMLVNYSRAPIDGKLVQTWRSSLADKRVVKTDDTFECQLQMRDVALAALEAITGESFVLGKPGKTTPVKEIVAYPSKDSTWRFQIAKLTDDEYESVAHNVDYWIAGYSRGISSKARSNGSPKGSSTTH